MDFVNETEERIKEKDFESDEDPDEEDDEKNIRLAISKTKSRPK